MPRNKARSFLFCLSYKIAQRLEIAV